MFAARRKRRRPVLQVLLQLAHGCGREGQAALHHAEEDDAQRPHVGKAGVSVKIEPGSGSGHAKRQRRRTFTSRRDEEAEVGPRRHQRHSRVWLEGRGSSRDGRGRDRNRNRLLGQGRAKPACVAPGTGAGSTAGSCGKDGGEDDLRRGIERRTNRRARPAAILNRGREAKVRDLDYKAVRQPRGLTVGGAVRSECLHLRSCLSRRLPKPMRLGRVNKNVRLQWQQRPGVGAACGRGSAVEFSVRGRHCSERVPDV